MYFPEYLKISNDLMKYHSIFNKLWGLGRPEWDTSIPTAAVGFDKVGDTITFRINPDFWKTLEYKQKLFIICHECLHVLLYHGYRIRNLPAPLFPLANMALDVVVNHMLVDRFDFKREEVDPPTSMTIKDDKGVETVKDLPNGRLCWTDTVFQGITPIPDSGKYFEYYFNILCKNVEIVQVQGSLDDHDGLSDFIKNSSAFEKFLEKTLDHNEVKTFKDVVDSHTKDLNEFKGDKSKLQETKDKPEDKKDGGKQAGTEPGSSWKRITVQRLKPNPKFETIIQRFTSSKIIEIEKMQWQRKARRMEGLASDFFLPSEQEIEAFDKKRVGLSFFIDTSGSVFHLAERFFKVAMQIPKDAFDVKLYTFDTKIYEIDIKNPRAMGGGGTAFDIIEGFLQKEIQLGKIAKYPDSLWIVTDGMGNSVKFQHPKRVNVFLTENYKDCFSQPEISFHDLRDFE